MRVVGASRDVTLAPSAEGRAFEDHGGQAAPVGRRRRAVRLVRRTDVLLLLVVLLGGVLRFHGLGQQSLWFDEWSTFDATRGDFERLLRYVAWREGTPPPYFLVVWGWVRIFGDSEFALRTVSALAGTAAVPVGYAVARDLGQPRRVARIAAVLVAVNPMLVWISQEARPYSLLVLAGALSVLAFVRLWRRGRQQDVVVWAGASALVLGLHYFGGFIVAAEALCLVFGRRLRGRQLVLPGLACLAVLAAHAPFLVSQRSYSSNQQWIGNISLSGRLEEAGQTALVGPSVPDGRMWIGVAGVAALAVVLLVGRGQSAGRRAACLAGGVGALAVVFPLVADLAGPEVFLSRYLVASTVPVLVAVAVGLGRDRARGLVGLAGLALVLVISVSTVVAVSRDPDLQRADWAAVADVVAPTDEDGGYRLLVMNLHGYAGWALRYYLPDVEQLGRNEAIRVERIDVLRAKAVTDPCNVIVGRPCGMWFLGMPPPPPLAQQLVLEESVELDQFYVDRYRAETPVRVMVKDLVIPDQVKVAKVFVIGP